MYEKKESAVKKRERLLREWEAMKEVKKAEESTLSKVWGAVKGLASEAAQSVSTKFSYDERAKQAAKGRK